MQKATEDGFDASGFNGAAVVLDPRNGEVLAFTSRPAYDPERVRRRHRSRDVGALNTDELKPLQNRALQGRYSPGSTFKMAVGLAGLEEGVITPDFRVFCGGGADVLRPLLQVLEEGRARHASICATRSSSRATCTSTRSATCSASTASTSGRRCSASA